MRNLKNIKHTSIKFPDFGLPLSATAWDADTDGLICAFGPSQIEAVIELKRFDNSASAPEHGRLIASWDAPCPLPELACDRIISLKYFSDTQSACLILEGGDLVIVRESPLPGEDLIEIVGSIDAGITAAAWSPDDEMVAISTRADTFLLMTRQFESTASATISPDDVKVSAHVSVGWGKRETQFQGKRAKAMRDPTVPEHVDEGVLSPHDNGKTSITWRGDGAYVAMNTVEQSKRRMIRVYSREGILDSVSEPVDGLESALSWRPAGNLIAGIQHRSDRTDVVFFERNGLRHGEFTLRLGSGDRPDWAKDISLGWNNDSTVLAVAFSDRVQLYTMGNYHHYLKADIPLDSGSSSTGITWHQEKALMLSSHSEAELAVTSYTLSISSGTVLPPHDHGLAMVVDGASLKVTPLRMANVPPPMALFDTGLTANAIDACTDATGQRIYVLHSDSVAIYDLHLLDTDEPSISSATSFALSLHPGTSSQARQIATDATGNIYVLTSVTNGEDDEVTIFDQTGKTIQHISLGAPVASITTSIDSGSVAYQIAGAKREGLNFGWIKNSNYSWQIEPQLRLPALCPQLNVWSEEDVTLVCGLSASGTLYVYGQSSTGSNFDQRLQIRGVTSFLITAAHLIFTTTQHLVKFVHLNDGELHVPLDEPEQDERCRAVERGARLVTVMPSTYALVMQMPRGNLETIYPRALVLAGIRKAITAKDYRRAFFACRNHRVDMNIIHDYAPEQFMGCIPLFIDQVQKPVHIDLFLSQLRDEDVTETLYKDTLTTPKPAVAPEAVDQATAANSPVVSLSAQGSKTNRICDGFLKALDGRRETHLQNVVTSHVCKSPPDLPSGLRLVAELRESDPAKVDQAVEHICFLADVNRLYDAALGIYDLDVALLVAQQSQKDPREYLPYLQSLQELPSLRRRFTIDNDLKRFTKALEHLHALDDFVQLKTYAEKHELYSEAMELYKYNNERLNEIMRSYADFFSSRNRFADAGIAYEYLHDYSAASDAYLAAQMWRECLSSAMLAGQSKSDIESLATSLAEGLTESKEHTSAAQIYADTLDDTDNAARSYCKAHRYDEAIRVVALKGATALLTEVVDPGLGDGFASISELLAEMKTQLAAQIPRLRELRVKKAEDPLSFYSDAPGNDNPDIPDDISLAPSAATTGAGTFMTRYTRRTGSTFATNTTRRTVKNTRKEERKRARGKKGSVYEEEYLVASVGRLVDRLSGSAEDVGRLVQGLLRRGMRERAVAVAGLWKDVSAAAEVCLPEVFETGKEPLEEVKRTVPVVKKVELSALLG